MLSTEVKLALGTAWLIFFQITTKYKKKLAFLWVLFLVIKNNTKLTISIVNNSFQFFFPVLFIYFLAVAFVALLFLEKLFYCFFYGCKTIIIMIVIVIIVVIVIILILVIIVSWCIAFSDRFIIVVLIDNVIFSFSLSQCHFCIFNFGSHSLYIFFQGFMFIKQLLIFFFTRM